MTEPVSFQVFGIPQTKGSTKAFFRPGMKYPVITNDNTKNKPWAQTVAAMAHEHRPPDAPWIGPIRLSLVFVLPKPKSLPKRKPSWPVKRPDLDKLARSLGDALKGVFYRDDSQIVEAALVKCYGDAPGVVVTVIKVA